VVRALIKIEMAGTTRQRSEAFQRTKSDMGDDFGAVDLMPAPKPEAPPRERKRAFWYVKGGLYAEQIDRWLDHFPRSAFLFIKSEDFYRSPAAELTRVTDHLGLPRHRFRDLTPRNQRAYPTSLDPATRARLAELTGITWP
jgi:hypothetical protein